MKLELREDISDADLARLKTAIAENRNPWVLLPESTPHEQLRNRFTDAMEQYIASIIELSSSPCGRDDPEDE